MLTSALRLNGLVGNLARCSPDEPLVYKQWVIPMNVLNTLISLDSLALEPMSMLTVFLISDTCGHVDLRHAHRRLRIP